MRTKSTRAGPIGTPMGGNSRKVAARRNLSALIKAKDILTVQERGVSEIDSNVLDVCRIATGSPSLLTAGQGHMIWAVWQRLAEANKLRGIRTTRPLNGNDTVSGQHVHPLSLDDETQPTQTQEIRPPA